MEQLTEAKAKEGDLITEGQLKSLEPQERQRISSTRICEVDGRGRNGGIVTVIARDWNNEWQEIND